MSKGKLSDDVDELFVQKPTWTSETKTVAIESPEFMKKIDEKERVHSPRFQLAGVDFYIKITPGCKDTEFIRVALINCSGEDQTTSVTFTHESGAKRSWQMDKIGAKENSGFTKFLSYEKYQAWAKEHGDVFKLKAKVTLHQKGKSAKDGWIRSKPKLEPSIPETFPSLGKSLLEDDSTMDFTIRCPTKIFHVHKAILCARSEVLRASILTPMQEAAKGEIFVKEVGEKALGTIINFIYTGELELGENPDIVDLAWAGTKYLLPGFMDLLTLRLQMRKEELPGEMIADLLIAAHRHGAEDLRKLALDKIRVNRDIFNDPGFKQGMEEVPNSVMMEVFKDL